MMGDHLSTDEPSREDLAVTVANIKRMLSPPADPANGRNDHYNTPEKPRPRPELRLVVSN